jgi:hypothetical protein
MRSRWQVSRNAAGVKLLPKHTFALAATNGSTMIGHAAKDGCMYSSVALSGVIGPITVWPPFAASSIVFCVCMMPFGFPVVPEENTIAATSSGFGRSAATSKRAPFATMSL